MILTLLATPAIMKLKAVATPTMPGGKLTPVMLPAFARERLGLTGLTLTSPILAGADRDVLAKIRDAADRAGCPILGLVELETHSVADPDKAEATADRLQRLIQAANFLGASSVGVPIQAPDDDDAMTDVAEVVRPVLKKAERLEINLALATAPGLASKADRLGELLKKIGGFRVGTMPDFKSAHDSGDAPAYLKKLVPYASTVVAVSSKFETSGTGKSAKTVHKPYDLKPYCEVLLAVGYDGVVAIDYRGTGDAITGIENTRSALQTTLRESLPDHEDDDLDLDIDEIVAEVEKEAETEE
ncbi:MAG: sugar phosphate isomerase/epimerase family protein [Phycisphaerales bacterium]